jgi:hypothetical protein
MFLAESDNQIENEYTLAVLEAGSGWSSSTDRVRRFASNAVVLSQFAGESPFAFAARVEKKTRQLTGEFGPVLRAASVRVAPGDEPESRAARALLLRALARASADGCVVTMGFGSEAKSGDRTGARSLVRASRTAFERRGASLVLEAAHARTTS